MSQGHLLLELGDYAAARSRYEEGLALRRAAENTGPIARALLEVGHAAWLQGEPAATQSHAVEALALFQALEHPDGILAALEILAAAVLAQGQKERAARLLGAVEALRPALGRAGRSGGAGPESGWGKPCAPRRSSRSLRRRGRRGGRCRSRRSWLARSMAPPAADLPLRPLRQGASFLDAAVASACFSAQILPYVFSPRRNCTPAKPLSVGRAHATMHRSGRDEKHP